MTATDFHALEGSITELKGAIACLTVIAEGLDGSDDKEALLFIAYRMNEQREIAEKYLQGDYAAAEAAKGNGPRAVW